MNKLKQEQKLLNDTLHVEHMNFSLDNLNMIAQLTEEFDNKQKQMNGVLIHKHIIDFEIQEMTYELQSIKKVEDLISKWELELKRSLHEILRIHNDIFEFIADLLLY